MPTTTPFANLITFSRGSNATVVGPNGLVQWAPNNLVTFSEQFDNAAWTKAASTVTANTAVAPDGARTADTFTDDATNGPHNAIESVASAVAGQTYTLSLYAKASTSSVIQVLGRVATMGVNVWANFNLANGTVGAVGTGTTASIVAAGNGWYRCIVTGTATASGTGILAFLLTNNDANAIRQPSYAGTGTSVLIWGAQVEVGSAVTTYNPTTVKNLLGFSEAFDNAAWTKTRASIVTGAQANPVNGLFNAQKLMEDTTATNTHFTRQTVSNVPAGPVAFSAYVKAAGRSFVRLVDASYGNAAYFNLTNGTVGTTDTATGSVTDLGGGWYRCSLFYTSTVAGSHSYDIRLASAATGGSDTYTGDGNSGIYIYGAQLSDSASLDPYVPTPGAAPSSTAYYGPRFDYDPVTRAPRGILIEEQRTNLLLRSEEFDNAAWGKSASSVSANATTSPDGTVDADKLVEDSSTGQHALTVSVSTTGVSYALSVYAKASERTQIALVAFGASTVAAYFNLSNGTVVSGTGTITDAGNGWYRCSIVFTGGASSTLCAIYTAVSGSNSYAGNGTSGVFLWGAQLEAGAFATSYIPTIASTVTRSADVATITGQNFGQFYRQDAGTFAVEVSLAATGGNQRAVVSADLNATNNESVRLLYGSANTSAEGLVRTGSSTVASITVGSFTAGAIVKMAVAATLNSANAAANGATGVEDTSLTMPTPNLLNLGYSTQSASYLNGHIRSIRYIPVRAADFQLQALTT